MENPNGHIGEFKIHIVVKKIRHGFYAPKY
jgi:hypothetical protein